MDGPNFNSVLIAFFGAIASACAAYAAIKTHRNSEKIDTNTTETIKAKHAARKAANQTNGGLDALIRQVIEKVKHEDSVTRLDRIMLHVEETSKEHDKAPKQDGA